MVFVYILPIACALFTPRSFCRMLLVAQIANTTFYYQKTNALVIALERSLYTYLHCALIHTTVACGSQSMEPHYFPWADDLNAVYVFELPFRTQNPRLFLNFETQN